MKIERTKNAARNIVFGTALKLYQILVPFLLRTTMIYFMGIEYVGLNSLFVSVLQVLNLAELGVGSAMVFSMYQPVAEDDTVTICALMKLYRLYYRIVGAVIAVTGIVLTPFVPKLISGEVPDGINIYILYLLNLGATVLSYWLFAYKNSIFQAYQRTDITSKVTLITNTFQYAVQFLVICIFRNYHLFVVALLMTQALTNIITALSADKIYPQYQPVGTLERTKVKQINQRIRALFTAKLGYVIVSSVDTIVISAFLGLTVLAVYQNYYFILTSVIGFITIIFNSCTAGIGNSLIVETVEKNFSDLKKFTFIICGISNFCGCCFLCLYQPFMKVWVGEQYLLEYSAVVFFAIYFYTYEVNQLLNTYKDAAGIWHQDRFRPMITALVNLTLNLLSVNFWGIYGVLLSTIVSTLFIGMPWLLHNLFSFIFRKEMLKEFLSKLLMYTLVSVVSCIVTATVCSLINYDNLFTLMVRLLICMVIPNMIFFLIYRNSKEFRDSINMINMITKRKNSEPDEQIR